MQLWVQGLLLVGFGDKKMIKISLFISIMTLLLGVSLLFIDTIDSFIIAFFLSTSFVTFCIFILHLLNIDSFSKKHPTAYSFIFLIIIGIFAVVQNILENIINNWR